MKILVCCGSGVATSTMVETKIKQSLEAKGKSGFSVSHCRMIDIEANLNGVELLVYNVQLQKDYGVPTMKGMPFLTGIGLDKAVNEMIEILGL